MINTSAFEEILEALKAGTPVTEIAKDLTDTLNAAEEEYRKDCVRVEAQAAVNELVVQMNLALQNYCKLYGNVKQTNNSFTADEVRGILNAKIHGTNLDPVIAPVQREENIGRKKPTLQEFVDDMSEDEMRQAWEDTLQSLITLFSK